MLEGAMAEGETEVRRLPMLSREELSQILVEWNKTDVDFEPLISVETMFERQAERSPHAVAVEHGERSITYQELNERADRLGRYLQKFGVGQERIVGIWMERSLEMVIGLLGVLKSGAAYLPLDVSHPLQRIETLLLESRVDLVICDSNRKKGAAKLGLQAICMEEDREWSGEGGKDQTRREYDGENIAYVIYTSGSTGKPKGVMVSRRSLSNHMMWMTSELSESDTVLQKTPIGFDASVWEFYAPLIIGGRLIMAEDGRQMDVEYLTDEIRKRGVTVLQVVPTLLKMLAMGGKLKECPSLRRVYCGGEELSRELVNCYENEANAELCNLYGPTEGTIDATYKLIRQGETERKITIGRPVANTRIHLLDECLEPAGPGMKAEIYIGGECLARGYLLDGALTAEKFAPNPICRVAGERLYRTGDLGRYRSDGEIEYLGRKDGQVKVRGYRIEKGEIEAVLSAEEGVREAVVEVRSDPMGVAQLIGYVVGQAETIDGEALRRSLRRKLPEYMIPLRIIPLAQLPLNANGKVNRRELPEPDDWGGDSEGDYQAPNNPVEELVVKTLTEVLGVDRIGVRDNFFDLGGHSLAAMQVIARIREKLQVEMPLRSLFEFPIISDFAVEVAQKQADLASNGELASPLEEIIYSI
jgi:amino acid adenylation domain-containing protein